MRKVNIILSVLSSIFTAFLLVFVIFAWYATNKTAYVTGGLGRTKGDDYDLKLQRGIYKYETWFWEDTMDLSITNLQPGDSYFFRFEINYSKGVRFETAFSEISSALVENGLVSVTSDGNTYVQVNGTSQNWLQATSNAVNITEVVNGVNQQPKQLYSISNGIVNLNTTAYNVADTFYLYDYGIGNDTFNQDNIISLTDKKQNDQNTNIGRNILTSNPRVSYDLSTLASSSGTVYGYFALEFSDSLSTKTYVHIDGAVYSDSNLYQCQTLKIGAIALRDISGE